MRGSKPILISAPHSVRHWRDNNWKQEEEYTAALAYLLHQETGAHFIYGRYMLNPDPHDDADRGPYKRAIDDLVALTSIRLLIDNRALVRTTICIVVGIRVEHVTPVD